MADGDPSPPPPAAAGLSFLCSAPKRDDLQALRAKLAELEKSQAEMLAGIQGLRQDVRDWRSEMDAQVKIYQDEISELKKRMNTKLGQLKTMNASSENPQVSSEDDKRNAKLSALRWKLLLYKAKDLASKVI